MDILQESAEVCILLEQNGQISFIGTQYRGLDVCTRGGAEQITTKCTHSVSEINIWFMTAVTHNANCIICVLKAAMKRR